jgi:hypothetical protein
MKTRHGFRLVTFLLSICLFHSVAFAQADCVNAPITFSPGSQNQHFSNSAGSGSIGVIMQSDCGWHPVTNTFFLHLGQFVGLGQGNALFTVDANRDLAPRSGTITIFGNTSGSSANATITQDAATGGFTVTVNPASQIVTAGGNTTYTVTINRSGGFIGAVGLEVNGLPVNTTRSFNPNNTTAGSSIMTLTTGASTPGGTYPITIKGVNGNVTASVSASLTVNPVPTPTPTPAPANPGSGSSQLSSFLDATGVTTGAPAGQSIFYRATDQHIHHIFSNTAWFADDPTGATGAPAAVSGTSISSFLDVTGASTGKPAGQSIFYIAADQHVHHLFSNTSWFADDPSAGAGAPLAAPGSAITSFLDAAGKTLGGVPGQSVFYLGTDQHVHHLFTDTAWRNDDPTAGANAPLAANGSSLCSFLDPTGATTGGIPGQAIFYIGTDQHVHHLYSNTTWHTDDPTAITGATAAATGSPLACFLDPTGKLTRGIPGQAVFYIGTDQHVHHLFSDVSWHADDPTLGAGAPLAAVGSSLSTFFDPTGATTGGIAGQAIFFLGTDQHVHHIFSDTTWHNDDPSAGAGAPPALAGSPLSSFVDPTGVTTGRPSGQSIYYIGTDMHVHHIYSNTRWQTDDPTAMTGAPLSSL